MPVISLATNASESVLNQYSRSPGKPDILSDQQTFLERMNEGCPQMIIYDNITSVSKLTPMGLNIIPPRVMQKAQIQNFTITWNNKHPASDGKIGHNQD